MPRKITLIVVLIIAALGAAAWFVTRPASRSALLIPDLSPRAGERTPSQEFLKAQASIKRYRAEVEAHPGTIKNYIELAQVYLQEARITGRHHQYFPVADRIIEEALAREPDNFEATIIKASMLMTLHQFPEARERAEKAIAKNPYNAFAYGVLCDAHVELGAYDKAVQDCDKMMGTRPDLRSYARASYLREIHGDRAGAIQAMKLAADAGIFGDESREWALYNLGNLFLGMGKLDTAAFIYNGILEERPSYAFALSGLAQVANAKGEYTKAIELLVKASQLSNEHTFVEQLADIYYSIGDTASAKQFEAKVYDAFRIHEEGGWDVDREVAVFALNHNERLDEALERAKREYDRRPENIDALDTYAWALYKNGKSEEALPLVQRALRFNTQNGLLHYHAAAIELSLQKQSDATREIGTAFAESPYLNIIALKQANELRSVLGQIAAAN